MSVALRAALFFIVLTAAATYPLVNVFDPVLPDHDDAQFNVWRLSWVAHQLPRDPVHLFDGNIFFPARRTLAFSDAMLAVGFLGAPFMWLGVHPVVVHNLLLIAAIAACGMAAWALSRELTGNSAAALVGGVVFSLSPYRFGHIAHLELQWAVFMPLTLLVLHRAGTRERARPWSDGMRAGVLLALQGLSSLYYVVFFAIVLAVWSALMGAFGARDRWRFAKTLAVAGVTAMVLLAPYAATYLGAREQIGTRSAEEIQRYSAAPSDYLRVASCNALYPPGPHEGQDEHSLFPGATAIVLALAALVLGRNRLRWIYAAITVLAIDLSLGVNGVMYPLLLALVDPLASFRSPARFAVIVMLGLGVLASMGVDEIARRARGHVRSAIVFTLLVLMMIEYWSAPIFPRRVPLEPTNVYRWLAAQPQAVVLELPVPTPGTLWGSETTHQFNSIYHWQPLVNGYSGFAPKPYFDTLEAIAAGDPVEISARLQSVGVSHVVIHQNLLGAERFGNTLSFYASLPAALAPQSFVDPHDPAVVVPIKPAP